MKEQTKSASRETSEVKISRRSFIGAAAVTAAALAGGMAGCANQPASGSGQSASQSQGDAAPGSGEGETLLPNPEGLEFTKPQGAAVAFESQEIDAGEIKETIDCDVVICGAGISGATAAASAAQNGLSVVVLEKGSSFAARGTEIGAIGDRAHKEAGIELDGNAFLEDAMATAHFRCDRNVWKKWIDRSGEALDWGMDTVGDACGKFFCANQNSVFAGVTTWGSGVRLENGISSFVEAMLENAQSNGADIRYQTPACKLVRNDEGVVSGVIAKTDDGYIQVNGSRGVVLATGGYEYNWDMMTQTIRPRDLAVYAWINPTLTNTGDGHLMGLDIGAAEDDYPHILMNDPAGAKTGNRANGAMLAFLRVNENGERFVNENLSFEYMSNAIMYQPGAHGYVIMSGDILTALEKAKGGAPWTPEDMYDSIKEVLIEADSLEELAEKCGINYENFEKTIARYNELCEIGEDVDFGKNPTALLPVNEGPYYAVDESGCCLVSVNGLRTNAEAQVIGIDGAIIPNLYALGNASGSMFYGTYPHHLSAVSHGRCVTWGYLVGRELAGVE
ncbi:FAD-dependent oxidoreductase [Raoultibacter massiliensis]|uniref:FAD-dependent oxidoreductase n=1 Tax=Raoultibacter massiliensis TaxID=1852371 RepID=A0ABV1JCA5_9ACTN